MKLNKLVLMFIITVFAVALFGQYTQVTFNDLSTATRTLVLSENNAYPIAPPVGDRWVVQLYKTTDDTVDPLDTSANPTNDDVLVTGNQNSTYGLTFLPNQYWGSSAIRFYPSGTGTAFHGDKVYLRIFNSNSIATATKYIQFLRPYTVPSSNATVPVTLSVPPYGWSAWTPIVTIVDHYLTVESNYPGEPIYRDGSPTGEITPHVFTEAGLYVLMPTSPYMTYLPASYNWDGTSDQTIRFMGTLVPDPASNPGPADMATWTIPYDQAPATQMLTWDPPLAGPIPTGYIVWWNGAEVADVTAAPWQWTTTDLIPPAAAGTYDYTWKVVPYITDPAKGTTRSLKPVATRSSMASDKGESTAAVDWHFQIVRDPEIPTGIVVDEDGNVTGPATIVDGGTIPPELLGPDTNVPAVLYTLDATGTQDVEVFKPAQFTGDWYCWIKVGALLIAGGNPIPAATPSWTFTGVDFGVKFPATIVINDNATLPVELSSFTATLTATDFATYLVKLTWVSQSETGLLGYRVYRNSSSDQATATMITPTMVRPTNTSTTHTYSITDNEVSIGNTYWYWLESVDYGTSQFHGPVSVIVEGEVPPVIPTTTTMGNAYPNPFKVDGRTTIVVDVKANDAGSVTIYNILGQAVKTYPVIPGTNNITWNGRDSRGNVCGSGIYFYKLSTPSTNQTKKMVIVK